MIKKLLPIVSYTLNISNDIEDYSYEKVLKDYDKLFSNLKDIEEDILFALVCWIDEIILSSEWNEKNRWVFNSFQKKYFSTNKGGELFFEKMKQSDNKEIFAYFLKLGFRGKYYDDEYAVKELIEKYLPTQTIDKLFPLAYMKTPNKTIKFISLIYDSRIILGLIIIMIITFGIVYLNIDLEFTKVVK